MKILLDGYIDSNLGDDLMLALAARGLADNELYTTSEKCVRHGLDGAYAA